MFRRSISNESQSSTQSTQGEKTRVYVTSLKSITSTSPAKINWSASRSTPATVAPPSLARRALRRLLWPKRSDDPCSDADDNEPMISDSISDSKRLQNSILVLTQNESMLDEQEVHCCKQREAKGVILTLQKKAEHFIDHGKLHDALQNLNNSLALQQKLYGKKHSEVARTLNMMGEVLSNMGVDYQYMAMSALEESLAIRQELGEPGSEDTAVTLKNLWLLLHQSNVAISSVDNEVVFHDFDSNAQVY